MKEAQPGLRAALDAVKPGIALEGESTLPLARTCDHHLSWAQWFSDSDVPGVLRARWFEQRHMLHHTRRWNRDHTEELHSAWLNGVGVLVWENVFGAWVGWSERDKELLRAMRPVQREYAELLATGEWTPLAAREPGRERRRLALERRRDDALDGREPRRRLRGTGRRARGRAAGARDRGVRRHRADRGRGRRRSELPGARGGSRRGAASSASTRRRTGSSRSSRGR